MNYSKTSLENYLKLLGSDASAPGGGSAAAVVAATGAALGEMVAGINKRKHRPSGATARQIQKVKNKLLKLVTTDAIVFKRINKAFFEDRTSVKYQKALEAGARTPFEICGLCVRAARFAVFEKGRTSSWLMSDLKEALLLLQAAFISARLNVEINLKDMKEIKLKTQFIRALDNLEKEMNAYKTSVCA